MCDKFDLRNDYEVCKCRYNSLCQPDQYFIDHSTNLKNSQNRPSSANDRYAAIGKPTKMISSDSKIPTNSATRTNIKSVINKKSLIDPDSVQQLKQDLRTIKDQLFYLSENRNEALNITNELQMRYKYLKQKNKNYKREIEKLKTGNCQLIKQLKENEERKKQKINGLYQEFLGATADANYQQICNCSLEASSPNTKILENNFELRACHQCVQHFNEIENSRDKYQQLYQKYQEICEKTKILEACDQQRLEELQRLKLSEKNLLNQLEQLQNFIAELTTTNNKNNVTIAELNEAIRNKEAILQDIKADNAAKEKLLTSRNEEGLKQKMLQIQNEQLKRKSDSSQTQNSVNLGEDLQDLISALYQEVYKTMAKEAVIQQQNKDIRSLQSALSCKERLMMDTQNELNILREHCLCSNKLN